jgi:hypothetical protein
VKQGAAELIAGLEAQGLRFTSFERIEDGAYPAADVRWNQSDVAHVESVHGSFETLAPILSDDVAVEVFVLRPFGLRVPLTTAHYVVPGEARVSVTTMGPLALVIEARVEDVSGGTSRARARFAIGAPRCWRWLTPLAAWLVRRNHDRLAVDDEPLKLRRAELRRRGFTFRQDVEGASYAASLQIGRDNVVPPARGDAGDDATSRLGTLDVGESGRREWRLGSDDERGVRAIRDGNTIRGYPRLCLHDGASLDDATVCDGALVCPWHGRRWPALVSLDLAVGETASAEGRAIRLTRAGSTVTVERIGTGS